MSQQIFDVTELKIVPAEDGVELVIVRDNGSCDTISLYQSHNENIEEIKINAPK